MEEQKGIREDCLIILKAIWSNINWDNVGAMRRMKIYEEFASKIKSSAMTSSLVRFVEKMMQKFEIREIGNAEVLVILQKGQDRKMLKVLREETTILMLLLREWIGIKKEKHKEKEAKKNEEQS
ncbi:MAG: hypothetical protein KKE64_08255 [Candidatus Omnitrophica bacterium]|nr:hypothetical protein [Candidatus Omnitrophota bacterium]